MLTPILSFNNYVIDIQIMIFGTFIYILYVLMSCKGYISKYLEFSNTIQGAFCDDTNLFFSNKNILIPVNNSVPSQFIFECIYAFQSKF